MASASNPDLSQSFQTTPGHVMYTKMCRLVINGGTQVLRTVFDGFQPPGQLAAHLSKDAVQKTLKKLKPRIIKQNQWNLLYPTPPTTVSSKNFDITLLNILFRNVCNLSPPTTGWDDLPNHADDSLEADIVRMKCFRNDIHHRNNTDINENEFNRFWQDVRVVLVRLGANGDDIDNLKSSDMGAGESEACARVMKEWKQQDLALKEEMETIKRQTSEHGDKLHDIGERTGQIYRMLSQRQVEEVPPWAREPSCDGLQTARPNSSEPRDLALEGAATKCEVELRDIYRTTLSDVRPFPWSNPIHLEDIYTLPVLERKEGSRETTFDRVNLFTEMLVGRKLSQTRRVLIESDPGYGKSAFCLKLAHDWAMGDVEFLRDFRLVFLLRLQYFQGKIQDAIFETLLPEDCFISKDDLWEYIRKNQEKVLFLLDGWDEMSETATEDIKKILEGKMLRHCRVVLTSRKIRDDKVKQRIMAHFDLSLQLKGFTLESLKEYVCKHFEVTEQADRVNTFIEEVNRSQVKDTLLQMMSCPLNSLLICDMWTDTGSLTKNKTQLYERIADIILKIYCENEGREYNGPLKYDIDKQFTFLGELAFKSLLDKDFKIDKSGLNLEENRDILRMGFLTRYTVTKQVVLTVDPMSSLLIHHRTFQEFFAAKYLASLCRAKNLHNFSESLQVFYSRMATDCASVFQFIAGFLNRDCVHLFDVFKGSISHLDILIDCLQETSAPETPSLLKSAAEAMADKCTISNFDSDKFINATICEDMVQNWPVKTRYLSVLLRLGHPLHIKLYKSLLGAMARKGALLSVTVEFRNILKEQEISRGSHSDVTDFTRLDIATKRPAVTTTETSADIGSTARLTPEHIDSIFGLIVGCSVRSLFITCCSADLVAIHRFWQKLKESDSLNSASVILTEPHLADGLGSPENAFDRSLQASTDHLKDGGFSCVYRVDGEEISIDVSKHAVVEKKPTYSFYLQRCKVQPFIQSIIVHLKPKDGCGVRSVNLSHCDAKYDDYIRTCENLSAYQIECLKFDNPGRGDAGPSLQEFAQFVCAVISIVSLRRLSIKAWPFPSLRDGDLHTWTYQWRMLLEKLHQVDLSLCLPSDRSIHDAESHPMIAGLRLAAESSSKATTDMSVDLSENKLSEGDVVDLERLPPNIKIAYSDCDMSERSRKLFHLRQQSFLRD